MVYITPTTLIDAAYVFYKEYHFIMSMLLPLWDRPVAGGSIHWADVSHPLECQGTPHLRQKSPPNMSQPLLLSLSKIFVLPKV